MRTKLFILTTALLFSTFSSIKADEGMWLPLLLGEKYNEMQKMGLKLTPQQLYDVNHNSLKDAIVVLDRGSCTGEMISKEGLLLTNHHCGYGEIQAHSSVEHDYLTNGFWAKTMAEELPNPEKSVSFLVRIEDVTSKVLVDVNSSMTEQERSASINKAIQKITKETTKDTHYEAKVSSMFSGNEFYLFVYETFLDVRLVGAPPSSIGNFGGDTDNWMWPRHTGDFSIFRVYCAPDGTPAPYSKNNVPYKPKHVLPISTKGIHKDDFAMIWGYPGTTDRYLSSYGIQLKAGQLNPASVKLKEARMKIMKEYMDKDKHIEIQYADKHKLLGNFWKKDYEETESLKKLRVVNQKKNIEDEFDTWANSNEDRKKIYGDVVKNLAECYTQKIDNKYDLARAYVIEATFYQGAEILTFSFNYEDLIDSLNNGKLNPDYVASLKEEAKKFYKDYNADIDKKILASMLNYFDQDIPTNLHPDILNYIDKKFKGNYEKYADDVFKNSIFSSEERFNKFLDKPCPKKLSNDPALKTMQSLYKSMVGYNAAQKEITQKLQKTKRLFVAGLQEMNPGKTFYPDANSTMRISYGKILDYDPRDAVHYNYYTTLNGIIEKEDSLSEEFIVPKKLKEIYTKKDYARYGESGQMPVCFLTDNDITGGNSGSPVINGSGELIGVAFDGNSEALCSDIKFVPALQRTIVCDIRYVLLIIDKYADAKNIINELSIVN